MNLTQLAQYFSLVIGFFTLLIGIMATIQPQKMSKNFGIAVDGLALPYVVSTGIRDVFMGLVIFVLFYHEAWPSMGATFVCLGIVAISDFLVVRKYGDKRLSLIHLSGAVVVIVYGILLFMGN